jgi:hypothetical protein
MGVVLVRPVLSSVTPALFSYSLMVRQQVQNTLVGFLVHPFGPDRHSAAFSPFKSRAQLLYSTRRAVPAVAHGGLIGDASAFAASEKPDVVMVIGIPSIEDARRAGTFAA